MIWYLSPENYLSDVSDYESPEEYNILPPVTWLTSGNDNTEMVEHEVECTNNIASQGRVHLGYIWPERFLLKFF